MSKREPDYSRHRASFLSPEIRRQWSVAHCRRSCDSQPNRRVGILSSTARSLILVPSRRRCAATGRPTRSSSFASLGHTLSRSCWIPTRRSRLVGSGRTWGVGASACSSASRESHAMDGPSRSQGSEAEQALAARTYWGPVSRDALAGAQESPPLACTMAAAHGQWESNRPRALAVEHSTKRGLRP